MKLHVWTGVVCFASTLLFGKAALAATFYVATDGDDGGTGTVDDPWATLQHAVDSINPGDTIMVESGTYAGCRIGMSGAPGAPKTLMAASTDVVVDQPGPDNKHDSDIEVENFDLTVTDWNIVGLHVIDAPNYGIDIRVTNRISVEGVHVEYSGATGIFTAFSNHTTVSGSESDNNDEHGIYFSNSGDYPTAYQNSLHDNAACGVQINADKTQGGDGIISNFRIDSNMIFYNGTSGGAAINLDGATHGTVVNNLLYDNYAGGIALYALFGAVGSSNDTVYNNTLVMPSGARDAIQIPRSPSGVQNPRNDTIENNILYSPDQTSITIYSPNTGSTGIHSDYNVVVNRFSFNDDTTIVSLATWRSRTGNDRHSFIATPTQLFVNPGANDYELTPGSPAIDRGTALPTVTVDIIGNPRPQGSAWDIGAYEYPDPDQDPSPPGCHPAQDR